MKEIENFESIVDQITEKGFAVIDNFISKELAKSLRKTLKNRFKNDEFKQASISKDKEIRQEIRGDKILWIDNASEIQSEKIYMNKINNLISYFNSTCFTGLKSFEIHYAVYPKSSYYKRHLDVFRTDTGRKYSVICYLNKNWIPENGGQLMLYLGDNNLEILPLEGRLVIFESQKIEHEVLPTLKKRKSITGWLKNKDTFL